MRRQILIIDSDVPTDAVRRAIRTALVVASALHGAPALLLGSPPRFDPDEGRVELDTSTGVGACVAKALVGLIAHEHGAGSVLPKEERFERW